MAVFSEHKLPLTYFKNSLFLRWFPKHQDSSKEFQNLTILEKKATTLKLIDLTIPKLIGYSITCNRTHHIINWDENPRTSIERTDNIKLRNENSKHLHSISKLKQKKGRTSIKNKGSISILETEMRRKVGKNEPLCSFSVFHTFWNSLQKSPLLSQNALIQSHSHLRFLYELWYFCSPTRAFWNQFCALNFGRGSSAWFNSTLPFSNG